MLKIPYVNTAKGKLVKCFELYCMINNNKLPFKNYTQWVNHATNYLRLNVDYFHDRENHMPYKMPLKRIRYFVTIDVAKHFCLQKMSKKALIVYDEIKRTEFMPFNEVNFQ